MPCNANFRACLFGTVLAWATTATIIGAGAAELTFDLQIERGRVAENMSVIRVKQGDVVRLRWSTDRSIILHLYGYDIKTKFELGVFLVIKRVVFFFQAEDGIRDHCVTGVQTCALPI